MAEKLNVGEKVVIIIKAVIMSADASAEYIVGDKNYPDAKNVFALTGFGIQEDDFDIIPAENVRTIEF